LFIFIRKESKPFDRENPFKPTPWRDQIDANFESMTANLVSLKQLYWDYCDFCRNQVKTRIDNKQIKNIDRALFLLDICSKEDKNEE
jgi:hypothetical protein